MTRLLEHAIEALKQLEELPEKEQDSCAASILDYLRTRREQQDGESEEAASYSSFDVLRKARLHGKPDASVTYERELYGREDALDA